MKRLTLIVALAASFAAHATDGVFEINQVKLDAAGGTYTITQPGSYRLTSNLKQSGTNAAVIAISADNVTLDLNGFVISGGNTCTGYGSGLVVCSNTGDGVGIWSNGRGTVVKNGTLTAIASNCVLLGANSNYAAIDHVQVSQCGGAGIALNGDAGTSVAWSKAAICLGEGIRAHQVSNSVAIANMSTGIVALERVSDSTASANDTGVSASLAINVYAAYNLHDGISASVVIGSYSMSNQGAGVAPHGFSEVLLSQTVLRNNASPTTGSVYSVPANGNLCNGSPC